VDCADVVSECVGFFEKPVRGLDFARTSFEDGWQKPLIRCDAQFDTDSDRQQTTRPLAGWSSHRASLNARS